MSDFYWSKKKKKRTFSEKRKFPNFLRSKLTSLVVVNYYNH